MKPQTAEWRRSKSIADLRRSQSMRVVTEASDHVPDIVTRPSGIIRIRVSPNDDHMTNFGAPTEEQPIKDDDDSDSAISLEIGDDHSDDLDNSRSTAAKRKNLLPALINIEEPRRFYQRRHGVTARRTSNCNRSAAAKAKSRSQQAAEPRQQLGASGGSGSLPAWKLRKAMKTFKTSRLAGNGGPESEFGAPHIQYFLASLCDHPAESKTSLTSRDGTSENRSSFDNSSMSAGLRARCPLAAEVRKLVAKLRSSEPVNAQGYQLSVAVTVLKEFLSGIPDGVFGELTEEFYQISLESRLDLTIMYLHSILHEMPYIVQQFTYLLCKALRNLIRLTGGFSIKNYTDLLMHFTPVLFASSIGDIDKFLRAARLLLVMVDDCERVFLPLPWLDAKGNWCWHNGDFEDETFFRQIFDSLQNLEARLATDDSGVESEPEDATVMSTEGVLTRRSLSTCSLLDFYQVVYVDDSTEDAVSTNDHGAS